MKQTKVCILAALAILLATVAGICGDTLSSDPEWRADVSDPGITLIETLSAGEGASAVLLYDEADALFG
jgi:hypothetical protein